MNNVDIEAKRRVDRAADMLESAIRLGADPEYAAREMRIAVTRGAEQLAEDIQEAYREKA